MRGTKKHLIQGLAGIVLSSMLVFAIFFCLMICLIITASLSLAAGSGDSGSSVASPGLASDILLDPLSNASKVPATSQYQASSMINNFEYNLSQARSSGYRMEQLDGMLYEMKGMYDARDYDGVDSLYADASSQLSIFYSQQRQYLEFKEILSFSEIRYSEHSEIISENISSENVSGIRTGGETVADYVTSLNDANAALYACIDTGDYVLCNPLISALRYNMTLMLKKMLEDESSAMTDIFNTYRMAENAPGSLGNPEDNQKDNPDHSGNLSLTIASMISSYSRIRDSQTTLKDYRYYYSLVRRLDDINKMHQISSFRSSIDGILVSLALGNHSTSRLQEEYTLLSESFGEDINRAESSGYIGGLIDYDTFVLKYDDLSRRAGSAIKLSGDIDSTRDLMIRNSGKGIDYSEAEYLLSLAVEEFNVENYEKSAEYLDEAKISIDDIESRNALKSFMYDIQTRFNVMDYIKQHLLGLILTLVISVISIYAALFFYSYMIIRLKMTRLSREQEIILSLEMKLQEDYYRDKVIDHDTYASQYDSYQERLADIRRDLPTLMHDLEDRRSRMRKISSIFGIKRSTTSREESKKRSETGKSDGSGKLQGSMSEKNMKTLVIILFSAILVAMMLLDMGLVSARLVASGLNGTVVSNPSLVLLDKDYYQENDPVTIFLPNIGLAESDDNASPSISLEISLREDPTYNLRYLGLVDNKVVFIPSKAGNYILRIYSSGPSGQEDSVLFEKSFIVYGLNLDKCIARNTGEPVTVDFRDYGYSDAPKNIVMIFSHANPEGGQSSEKWVYNQDVKDTLTYVPSRPGKYSLYDGEKYIVCFSVEGQAVENHQAIIQYSPEDGTYIVNDTLLADDSLGRSNFTQSMQYGLDTLEGDGKAIDGRQKLALLILAGRFYADENTDGANTDDSGSQIKGLGSTGLGGNGPSGINSLGNSLVMSPDNSNAIKISDSKGRIIEAYIAIDNSSGDASGDNVTASNASESSDIIEGNIYDLGPEIRSIMSSKSSGSSQEHVQGDGQDVKSADSSDDSVRDTELYFAHDTVKKIRFNHLRYRSSSSDAGASMNLNMEDVPAETIMSAERERKDLGNRFDLMLEKNNRKLVNTFAIDPTGLDFTDGQMTIEATGRELYKCREWNFTQQRCYGTWVKILDLVPGQLYNITLSSVDPAYAQLIQPTNITGVDTYLSEQVPQTNYGGVISLQLNNRAGRQLSPLIYLNLSYIPSNAKIRYAELQLYETATGSGNGVPSAIKRMTRGWVENQTNWSVSQIGTGWTIKGGDYAATVYNYSNISNTVGWKLFNITTLVAEWVNGTYINYGLILVNTTSGGTTVSTKVFASSDYTLNISLRPRFIINYSVDTSGILIYNESGAKNYSMTGTFTGTNFENYWTYAVILNSGANAYNGSWSSTIFDGVDNTSWQSMVWSSNAIGELPDNKSKETFGNGNVDMTNNVLLYHMEDMSGNVTDSSGSGNNGVNFGATYLDTGQMGYGMNFDGVSNYIRVADNPSVDFGAAGTISLWIYKRGNSTYGGLVHKGDLASWADEALSLQYYPTNITLYLQNAALTSNTITGSVLEDNQWYHIVATWDQTRAAVYVNGVLKKTQANNIIPMNSAGGLNIGCQVNSSPCYPFNGTMDELAIWNVSLSEAEIFSLYERGVVRLNLSARSCALSDCSDVNFTYIGDNSPQNLSLPLNRYFQFRYDFITKNLTQTPELYNISIYSAMPPKSFLEVPRDMIYTSNNSVNFTCNGTDDALLKNVTLFWNYTGVWAENSTFSIGGRFNRTSFIMTGLSDGTISWNCRVCDNESSCSYALSNRTLIIDTTLPTIDYISPTDDNRSYISRNWSIINVTVSEPVVNCTLNWSGALSNMTNTSATIWSFNKTILSDGNYVFYVTCRDYANNTGRSLVYNITRDMTRPVVNYDPSTQVSGVLISRNFAYVNVTVSESVSLCTMNVTGVEQGLFNLTNISTTSWYTNHTLAVDGFYNYTVYCIDYASNIGNTSSRNITRDMTPPLITFIDPTYPDAAQTSQNFTTINITLSENVTVCLLNWTNSTSNATYLMNNLSRTAWYRFMSDLRDGSYSYIVSCNDSVNNVGYSDPMTLKINTTNSIYFTGMTTQPGEYIRDYIFVNVTSANFFSETITLRVYNSSGSIINTTTMTTSTNSKSLARNFTLLPDGTYYFNATSNDTLGHNSSTETRTVLLDSHAPELSLVSPQNNTFYDDTTGSVNIVVNASDILMLDTVMIRLTLANGTNITSSMAHGALKTYSYLLDTGYVVGSYTATITANDSLNNINSTTTIFFLHVPGRSINIVGNDMSGLNYSQVIVSNVSGILRVDMYPENHSIKKISVEGYNEASRNNIIRIDDDISPGDEYLKSYSINLDGLNYTSANFTITATGYNILKCANFTFLTQTCNDEEYLPLLSGMVAGDNYTIDYNATDPGFYETLQGSLEARDSYMRQGTANTNYGTATSLRVGKTTSNNAHRTIIWFNISDLPPDATVMWANLSIYFYSVPVGNVNNNRTYNVHKVLPSRPWVESQVTWNRYVTASTWTTAGGDYNTTVSASRSFNSSVLNSWITFEVTADLQAFIINQSTYYGWVIKDSDESTLNTLRYFASNQYGNATIAPRLDYLLSDGSSGTYLMNDTVTKYAFMEGLFNRTRFSYTNYTIALKNSTTTNGTWTSQIFDASVNVSWYSLSWTARPYGNLPSDGMTESRFSVGNANMTGNVLLMHLDNDSQYLESGTSFHDFSGNGNTGSCSGTTCPAYNASGKMNSAYTFDGATDFINVSVPSGSSLDISLNQLTIEAWVKWNINPSTGSASASIVNRNDAGTGWGLAHSSDNSRFRFYIGNPMTAIQSNTTTVQGRWYHVAGVYDGSTLKLYVNGVLENTTSRTATVPISGSNLTIGRTAVTAASYFSGTIDEVAVYSRGLSQQEVLDHYRRGTVRFNMSARSCSNPACTDANFTTINGSSPQILAQRLSDGVVMLSNNSISSNRYFQYRIYLEADNGTYGPELSNATIIYYRDVYVENGGVFFSNNKPLENETITVYSIVRSDYNISFSNVLARFYDGNPETGGTQIGPDVYFNITGMNNKTINTTWNVPIGSHTVYVSVDPQSILIETNVTNNKAYNRTSVPSWQTYYGNITVFNQLGKSTGEDDDVVMNWSTKYYPTANIYAAPSGSSINWLALQALSRNSTGGMDGNTLDDFDELDMALNLTDFVDSSNVTYMNSTSGNPSKLDNYTLYYRNVSYVPEASSTNNTNYYTGILWDMNSTSSPYYVYDAVPSSRPNIVFVTKVNYNQTGSFGQYDYEMRVPAPLREYHGAGETVSFYYEIK